MQAISGARAWLGGPSGTAALGAGGRFAPGAVDLREIELFDEALAELPPGDSALRVRSWHARPRTSCAPNPGRARKLADEAAAMARRLGEPEALAAALVGQHAALLHADHAKQRRRLAEALAVAGELGALEMSALGRHWLLYDLAELGELDEARRRHGELELLAADLQQPLYRRGARGGAY